MKYRTLGKTNFKVSEVSLGTWQLGGKWGEKFNPDTAEAILSKAIDEGVNFIDTADVYNDGQSERAIGKFVKKVNQRIYVATKAGRRLSPHTTEGYNKKNITKFVDDSLKNMGLEAVEELKRIFDEGELAEYALRWILMNDDVSCIIPGASKVYQIETNTGASELPPLADDQMEEVKKIYQKYIKKYVHGLW